MAEQSAQAKPADTRIDGATNGVAIEGMTLAVETIEAFAREIAEMTWQAVDRADQCIEKLCKADRTEEAAAIQADFLKESMEHAVQHIRKYIEMLATFPHELVEPVNAAVKIAEATRYATAASVEHLSEVARKA
jgi:phasin family protein